MTNLKSLRILAVGDIMLGEHPGSLGVGVLSKWKITKKHPFHHIDEFLRQYDVVIGNLESVLSYKSIKSGYRGRFLRAPPSVASVLAKSGFQVLSVANNHSMDHGFDAFKETVNSLQCAGILVCGTKRDPVRLEVKTSRIGTPKIISFFGASFRPNDTNFDPLYTIIEEQHDLETFTNRIHQESKSSDLVVIQCHWGDEFITTPSIEQVQVAKKLVQSGADVIVGHHPHVYQGFLRIHNIPVFFSLGNFVSDMPETYLRKSAVASIIWNGSEFTVTSIPIRLDTNHHPYLSKQEQDWEFIQSVNRLVPIVNSQGYSTFYQQTLHRAELRYRADIILNLIRNLGLLPAQKVRLIIDNIGRLSGIR